MYLFILGKCLIVNIFVGFTIYESGFLYYNEALEYIRAPGLGTYAAPDFTGRGIYTWEDIRYGTTYWSMPNFLFNALYLAINS